MPAEIPCQPSGLMEVEGKVAKNWVFLYNLRVEEKVGESRSAEKHRALSCVRRSVDTAPGCQ